MMKKNKWEQIAQGNRNLVRKEPKKKLYLCAFGDRRFNIEAYNLTEACDIASFWDSVLLCEVKLTVPKEVHPDIDLTMYGIKCEPLKKYPVISKLDLDTLRYVL